MDELILKKSQNITSFNGEIAKNDSKLDFEYKSVSPNSIKCKSNPQS